MSTRSGKRLHKSFHENVVKECPEVVVNSERKTRSKHLKENLSDLNVTSLKPKKRQNYVKYPSEEDTTVTDIYEKGEQKCPARNNTLKEKNINLDDSAILKKVTRSTRSTRKILHNNSEKAHKSNCNVDEVVKKQNKKYKLEKSVKTEVTASKKKSKKRETTSGSFIVEDFVTDEQNESSDSFHSAAGSPLQEKFEADEIFTSESQLNINGTYNIGTEDVPLQKSRRSKKRKSSDKNMEMKSKKNNKKPKKKSDLNDSLDKPGDTNSETTEIKSDTNLCESIIHKSLRKRQKNVNSEYNIESMTKNKDFKSNKRKKGAKCNESNMIVEKSLNSTIDDLNIENIPENVPKKELFNLTASIDKDSSVKENNITLNNTQINRTPLIITTFEKENTTFNQGSEEIGNIKLDITYEKASVSFINEDNVSVEKNKNPKIGKKETASMNSTYDKMDTSLSNDKHLRLQSSFGVNNRNSQIKETTYDKTDLSIIGIDDTTFEKDTSDNKNDKDMKSDNYVLTANNTPATIPKILIDTTFEKDDSKVNRESPFDNKISNVRNSTFEIDNVKFNATNFDNNKINMDADNKSDNKMANMIKIIINNDSIDKDITSEQDETHENEIKKEEKEQLITSFITSNERNFDETFDRSSRSSIISSDGSFVPNVSRNAATSSSEAAKVSSIRCNESENIINITPVLIESSIDETLSPCTPIAREGTFTKDVSEGIDLEVLKLPSTSPTLKNDLSTAGLLTAGCTPYHLSGRKEKSAMNVTRSIEKKSPIDLTPRVTKVMFCSPLDSSTVMNQKRKIIKSSLKGSNKAFVFENGGHSVRPGSRKRSFTQSDADEAQAKRKRLAEGLQMSVDRLSRPRTSSATVQLTGVGTPSKKTPQKSRTDAKVARTKLPNFAALHQKQFDKMESLDECQERKAKRAKQLLTPKRTLVATDRSTTKGEQQKQGGPLPDEKTKSLPTLSSLKPGYTRFGFKLDVEDNPFLNGQKTDVKVTSAPKALPSLAGSTTVRKEAARQVVMREKSFTDRRVNKRKENRTIIKGVRTNRRFELQMQMRNID